MNSDPTTTPKPSTDQMGITFNEIHSDEPHEEVSVKQTTVEQKYVPKKSHLSNQSEVFNVSKAFESDRVESGTIVSDRRKRRATFGDNLRAAFSEWWGGVEEKITDTTESLQALQKKDTATVAKAESRVDVIKKATTNATLAPHDDHHIVVEKIRTYKQDVAKVTGTPLIIKKETEEKKNEWTHTTEIKTELGSTASHTPQIVATPDLRSAMIAPEIEQVIPYSSQAHDTNHQHEFEEKVQSIEEWYKKNPSLQKVSTIHTVEIPQKNDVSVSRTPVLIAPEVAQSTPVETTHTVPITVSHKETPRVQVPILPVSQEIKSPLAPSARSIPPLVWHEEAPVVNVQPEPVKPIPTVPLPVQETLTVTPQHTDVLVPKKSFRVTPPLPVVPESNSEDTAIRPPATIQKTLKEKTHRTEESRPYTPAPKDESIRIYARWAILIGIVIVGFALAIFTSMYFNIFAKNEVLENIPTTSPTIIETTQEFEIPLGDTKEVFLNTLSRKIMEAPSGLVQFYPTISSEINIRFATSREIFSFLTTHLDTKTFRTLDETLMIGSVTTNKNEPFIIMRANNFDTLFAGMLSWETYIITDFSPLFGIPPQTNIRFTDAVRNNSATRILYDGTKNEILLYSFINQNTVVITTSSEALTKIIEQL